MTEDMTRSEEKKFLAFLQWLVQRGILRYDGPPIYLRSPERVLGISITPEQINEMFKHLTIKETL